MKKPKPQTIAAPTFACLGCGVTIETIQKMGLNRNMGIRVAGSNLCMPICSECEKDPIKMIQVLSSYIVPQEGRRRSEVETILWRVHTSLVAPLKVDLAVGSVAANVRELERRVREQQDSILHLQERPLPPESLWSLIKADLSKWLRRLVTRI